MESRIMSLDSPRRVESESVARTEIGRISADFFEISKTAYIFVAVSRMRFGDKAYSGTI
jgi:hypothetical protein